MGLDTAKGPGGDPSLTEEQVCNGSLMMQRLSDDPSLTEEQVGLHDVILHQALSPHLAVCHSTLTSGGGQRAELRAMGRQAAKSGFCASKFGATARSDGTQVGRYQTL